MVIQMSVQITPPLKIAPQQTSNIPGLSISQPPCTPRPPSRSDGFEQTTAYKARQVPDTCVCGGPTATVSAFVTVVTLPSIP